MFVPVSEAPRYPQIQVRIASRNPLALVAAVRFALRQARVDPGEIQRFSEEALAIPGGDSRRRVCARWVDVA